MPRPSEVYKTLEADPQTRLNKLPQPYRRVDKIIADIISTSIEQGEANQRERKRIQEQKAQTSDIKPSATHEDLGVVSCVSASSAGTHMFVGNEEGQLLVVHLPSSSTIVRSNVHPAPVEALAVASVVCKQGSCLLASASKKLVCVYLVGFDRSLLMLLCSGEPPSTDPQSTISTLELSSDGRSLFCASSNGACAVYSVPPVDDVESLGDGTGITRVVSVSAAAAVTYSGVPTPGAPTGVMVGIEALALVPPPKDKAGSERRGSVGSASSGGASGGPGQASQRKAVKPVLEEPTAEAAAAEEEEGGPKNSGDPSVNGLFVHWAASNHLVHFELYSPAHAGQIYTTANMPTGEPQPVPGSVAEDGTLVDSKPSRDWMLPFPITSSCLMGAQKVLFVGMADGSSVVYDLHLSRIMAVMPRLPGAVDSITHYSAAKQAAVMASQQGELAMVYLDPLVSNPHTSVPQHLARPLGDGPIHLVSFKEDESLVLLLKDGAVHFYDLNSGITVGEVLPEDEHEYPEAVHGSALWHYSHGLLLLGTNRVLPPEPTPVPTEHAEGEEGEEAPTEAPPPPAAEAEEGDAEPEPLKVPTCEKVFVYDIAKARKKLAPSTQAMQVSNPDPMIQRMLADAENLRPISSQRAALASREDALASHRTQATDFGSHAGVRFTNTKIQSGEGGVTTILDGIRGLGGGRNARMRRMNMRHNEIAQALKEMEK